MDYAALKAGDKISFDDQRLKDVPLRAFTEGCELQGLSPLPNGGDRVFTLRPSDEIDPEEEWISILITYGEDASQVVKEGTILSSALDKLLQENGEPDLKTDIVLLGKFLQDKDKDLPVHCIQVVETGKVIFLGEEFRGA